MGLKVRNQSALVNQDAPHYFMVYIENQIHGANSRCCGTRGDLESILELYSDARWEKIYLPQTPNPVDVMHVTVGKEQVLQAQQVLQPSDTEPFQPSQPPDEVQPDD